MIQKIVKIYYAHSIQEYGTEAEKSAIQKIIDAFDTTPVTIINPANLSEDFEAWKISGKKEDDHDMRFFKGIIKGCHGLIYSGNTSGVRYEIKKAEEFGIPIAELVDL